MRHVKHRIALTMGTLVWMLVTGGSWGGPADAEAAGESAFVGLAPCRLADTRGNGFGGEFGPPALAAGVPRDFPLRGQCGIPATALAVSLNVTATLTQGPDYPDLVVRDAEGAPETVRYHLLPALLLNELQRVVVEKDRQIAELAAALAALVAEVARLKERGSIAAGHGGDQP